MFPVSQAVLHVTVSRSGWMGGGVVVLSVLKTLCYSDLGGHCLHLAVCQLNWNLFSSWEGRVVQGNFMTINADRKAFKGC